MAAAPGLPKWLLDCKSQITESPEWGSLTRELFDAIQQQLTESKITYFTDLSEAEKTLFMQRAAKAIQHGKAFRNVQTNVSHSLDQHLNNQVAKELLEDFPVITKSDLIISHARDSVVAVLKKWPDMKSKLHLCLNQSLPDRLRQITWKLFLHNPHLRKQYVEILQTDPNNVMSILDLEIVQKSEDLLENETTFHELSGSVSILNAMKCTLSYHHARKRVQTSLHDTDYMLVVPFLVTSLATVHPDQLSHRNSIALLIEEYITFMKMRPGYMKESWTEDYKEGMQNFTDSVAKLLETNDEELSKHLKTLFSPTEADEGTHDTLIEGLKSLIRPMVRCLFVGYLQLDTVMFIWDQYIIGLDVPEYDIVPVVTVVTLMLLRDHILDCDIPVGIETVLADHAIKLKKEQYMYEINRNFYKDLYDLLNKDRTDMPILDPTQSLGLPGPWTHWSSEKLPRREKAQDRRQAREEREAQRLRTVQEQREADEQRRQQELMDRVEEEERFQKQMEEDRRRIEEERMYLEDQLEFEKKRRQDSERKAKEEIDLLRKEIEELRKNREKPHDPWPEYGNTHYNPPSRDSKRSPPPPSAATHDTKTWGAPTTAGGSTTETPPPGSGRRKHAETVTLNLLERIMDSVNYLGHSEGREKETLDSESKTSLKHYNRAYEEAQVQLFGRKLRAEEWDEMPANERTELNEKIMDYVWQKYEEKYASTLQ
uniref:Uncharacterized protein LOC102808036 n=1 Tax=Saccoglossus kowalevskii TaxID=10224 RepID=A0ABM0LXY0_SACKO|nr:PREDICTED: uncharacterized protein LOC102808036 [Saccoglossus kowalevskii]